MGEDCTIKVVRSLQSQVCQLMEAKKEEGGEELPLVTEEVAATMLRHLGVPEERVEAFEEKYREEFGENAELLPKNIADSKQLKVETPEVSIKVAPGYGDLVETRVIDGVRYVLVRADGDVSVNGVSIRF